MRFILFTLLSVFCITTSLSQSGISIDYTIKNRPLFKIKVNAGNKAPADLLQLYAIRSDSSVSTFPVIGDYTFFEDSLSFQPKFELNASIRFLVQQKDSSFYFNLPPKVQSSTVSISKIFPSTTEIPANILTFYIQFSAPMKPDPKAYELVDIVDLNGHKTPHAWRQKSYWINHNKTLVLMIHPGRVKHGIQATEHLAPVFTAGKEVQLVVNRGLESAEGGLLNKTDTLNYLITQKDTISPQLISHSLKLPKVNSRSPLEFTFTEPMDYGLIYKWFSLYLNDQKIVGNLTSADDKTWLFTPAEEWQTGTYTIKAGNKMGDYCHNQMDRLFEVDGEDKIQQTHYDYLEFQLPL